MTTTPDTRDPSADPDTFRRAVAALEGTQVRAEALVESIRPPQKLAPYSYALSIEITPRGGDDRDGATGRLVLLHDPDGAEAWDGDLRLVGYAEAELSSDMAGDPLLPQVGWSWLIDSLGERGAEYTAAGGTVTQTTSTRFGDVHGPATSTSLELRGSWTALDPDLTPHLLAFVDLLTIAAGLPPEGVTMLERR